MTDNAAPADTPAPVPPAAAPVTAAPAAAVHAASPPAPGTAAQGTVAGMASPPGIGWLLTASAVGVLSVVAITVALLSQQKVKALEQELVRRQQDSQGQAIEARALARQAHDSAQSAESKVSLLDARVTEAALQRTQFEELIQQLSRSRDENVLADVDAAVRVAVQQSALTGSAEPLTAALRQAEDRLARLNQPRVERVRRALARDLDRVRAAAVVDIASLAIKLDEVMRSTDELPMVAQIERRLAPATPAKAASAPASAASAATGLASGWVQSWAWLRDKAGDAVGRVWQEARGLVRVTRVDNADAMLVAPEQAWFVRENLKLRVLNARLALMSRQFDTTQSDLREVQGMLDRYFDRSARRVQIASEMVRQVASQARGLSLPRPDDTLAALAAAQAGR